MESALGVKIQTSEERPPGEERRRRHRLQRHTDTDQRRLPAPRQDERQIDEHREQNRVDGHARAWQVSQPVVRDVRLLV